MGINVTLGFGDGEEVVLVTVLGPGLASSGRAHESLPRLTRKAWEGFANCAC